MKLFARLSFLLMTIVPVSVLSAATEPEQTVLGKLTTAIATGKTIEAENLIPKLDNADHPINPIQETPLTLAAMNGRSEIVRLLIADGADVNHRTTNGWTALMFASRGELTPTQQGMTVKETKEFVETVQALLDAGAEKKSKNIDGDTALTLAKKAGNKEIVKRLQK
jgi:ankyrin repeat protein